MKADAISCNQLSLFKNITDRQSGVAVVHNNYLEINTTNTPTISSNYYKDTNPNFSTIITSNKF